MGRYRIRHLLISCVLVGGGAPARGVAAGEPDGELEAAARVEARLVDGERTVADERERRPVVDRAQLVRREPRQAL